MFKKARLKLTAWYLAIIMVVSFSFSCFIYKIVSDEFQRRFEVIEDRLELRRFGLRPPFGQARFFMADIREARQKVLLILIYTNGAIFIFSALGGYFLAGKTLSPIEEAMAEQKRFIADASHELKTPLTALQTSIEVALRDKKLKLKDAKKTLKESLTDIESLKNLTNDLLALARLQANNSKKQEVSLKKIARKSLTKFKALASQKKLSLVLGGQDISLKAVPESLEKLFSILLDNAIKYTSKGKIEVNIEKQRNYAAIKVSDSGIGIAHDKLPFIFDRFYQTNQARSKTSDRGFGLGLSIAQKIVEEHNGTIKVVSKLGKGTTFTIKLPL